MPTVAPNRPKLPHLRDDLGRPAVGVVVLLHDRLHVALQPAIDGRQKVRLIALLPVPLVADVVHAASVLPVNLYAFGLLSVQPRFCAGITSSKYSYLL